MSQYNKKYVIRSGKQKILRKKIMQHIAHHTLVACSYQRMGRVHTPHLWVLAKVVEKFRIAIFFLQQNVSDRERALRNALKI
jgi:hypothetical protein